MWIIFHGDLGLKRCLLKVSLKQLLSSLKQLLTDVIFIWFTDRNVFALATMKNSHNNQLYSSVATKNQRIKHIGVKCCLQTRITLMMPVIVSIFDYSGLILLDLESESMKCVSLACFRHNRCCLSYESRLWQVWKQCPSIQVMLVFWC